MTVEVGDQMHASRRLADILRVKIQSGELRVGEKLPSHRQLAREYGVAPNTAGAAMRILKAEGLVVTRLASGSEVRDPLKITRRDDHPGQVRAELEDVQARLREIRRQLEIAEVVVADLVARLQDN